MESLPASAPPESPARELVRRLLAKKGIRMPGAGGIPSRPPEAPPRLSFPQQRLWFLHQLDPGSVAYNLSAAFRLTGRLDERALERSLETIVARHDALRMTFHAADGEGAYRIAPAVAVPIAREDLLDVAADAREAAIDAHVARLAAQPFDLEHGPLLRVGLLRVASDQHVLVLVIHHIVFDGWSIDVIVRELRESYAAFVQGQSPALPALPVQYQDFAHWQRARGDSDTLRAQREYWATRLAGLAPLDLPTDRRRPARPTLRGASHVFRLPPALTAAVRELARGHEATPFMVLLAGFYVLLGRYTGRDDLAVGSPIASRGETELEGLVGLFANTLVLRADLGGRPTFADLLARVRRLTLEAYQHQDIPFEHLVEELQPDRDTGRQPLFQVAFAMQHAGIDRLELAGLTLTPRQVASTASKFDLTLALTDEPDTIAGSVEYASDLFEPATIARMMRHYEALLDEGVRQPALPVADLDWIRPSDAARVGAPANAMEHMPVAERLHERFERQAGATPDAIAVSLEGERVTYAQLDDRANRLAAHLRRRFDVGCETRVGLFLDRSVDLVVAVLGVLKAGAAYVPVDPASPPDRVGYITADSGVLVVVTQAAVAARLPSLDVPVVVLDDEAEAIAAESPVSVAVPGDVTSAAYVIYTSGSTGRPKGVVVQHDHVQRLFLATDRWFGFGPDDVWTLFHSYGFDFSVWEIWGALLYGGRLVVVPYLVSRSPEAFHRLLDRERVTVLNQTPSAFTQLIAADAKVGRDSRLALRWVIFGGEALDLETLRPWFTRHGDAQPRLINMYGITETTVHVTYRPVTWADVERGSGSVIGEAIPDLAVHVCDEDMRLVPPGVPGEMFVGGAGVARGYLGRPDLTAARFVPDPFSGEPGARLYRSGDRARWRADGDLEYLGRLDDQVKIRGFRIELGEIESALLAHEGVSAAVVVARRDGDGDPRLVGYVVLRETDPPGRAELRRWLQQRLPDYMVPAVVMPIAALPLTGHGKVDRRALPEPDHDRLDDQAFVAPESDAEAALAAIWRDVLSLDRVGVADNFFAVGGDSIRAIKVVSRAREHGLDISLADLFQHQTIRALASHAPSGAAAVEVARAPFALVSADDRARMGPDVEDAYPLTLLQRGMLFHSQFSSGSAAYHNVSSFHLRVRFDQAAFEQAVDALIARHPVLRTSFDLTTYQEPLQIVHRRVARPLRIDDVRHLSAADQETHLAAWFADEQGRRFDWSQAPLLRVHVHRRGDDRVQLTLSEHHAILDGWSVASLLTELMTRYLAALGEVPSFDDRAAAVGFADYVADEIQARHSAESRAFWQRRTGDAPAPATVLPPGPSGSTPSTLSLVHRVVVPADVVDGLHAIARQAEAPLKAALLAAHMKVVATLGSVRDPVSGLVVNARPEGRDAERVLGLFLNTVPFRMPIGAASWVALVGRAFGIERELQPHRGFPLAELQRAHGGRPLFDVVFNFVHFHVYDALGRLPSLTLIDERSSAETNFPLGASFSFDATVGRLVLSLEAAPGGATIEQLRDLGERYVAVLAAMAADPQRSPDEMSLVLDRERRVPIDAPDVAEDPAPAPLVHLRVAEHARVTPGAPAIASAWGDLSYAALDERAGQLAAQLTSAGVRRGDRVAVCAEATPGFVAALLAVLRVGAAFVPIDPSYPSERVRLMLADARPSVLIGDRTRPIAQGFEGRVLWLDDPAVDTATPPPAVDVDPEDLAYVIYTSGSTGTPKGVMVRHAGLANLCAAQIRRFELHASSRTLLFASISFDAAVSEIFTTLVAGAALHLVPRERLRSPDALCDELRERAISVVTLPPTMLAAIDRVPGPALRTVISAGEPCTPEIVRRWAPGRRLLNAYGPTETSVCATMTGPLTDASGVVPIGAAIDRMQVLVLDAAMQPVPVGVRGELFVGGDGLARGYLHRPDLTADRFVPHPFASRPGARLYRTGDVVRWRTDGQLEFVGRADDQVKVRGVRIELEEVAAAVRAHPDVTHATVILREGGDRDPRLVAYVVCAAGRTPGIEAMRAFVAARVPDQAVPASFVVLDALPLTPSGKIDRAALPDPGAARPALDIAYVAPRTDVETKLAEAWARALGVARVGVDDDFFSLGGDSIVSLQVVARAQAAGIRVTPEDIFRHPTVAALASVARVADRTARRERPSGPVPLTPIQHWFFGQRLAVPSHWNQSLLLEVRAPVGRPSPAANVALLQRALDALNDAHDTLRMRFREDAAGWVQWYDDAEGRVPLEAIDLSALEAASRSAALAQHGERIQRSLDLTAGPLFRAALIHLGASQGDRLLLVAHHLVVDGVSWRVLIEDFQQALAALSEGRAPAIEPAGTSFQEWAAALAAHAASDDVRSQREFWADPARRDVRALPLDVDAVDSSANLESTADSVDVYLDEAETSALVRDVPPVYGTQINDALLAALVEGLAGWTGEQVLLVDLEGHGREAIADDLDLSRTVGWFTALYPVRLDVRGSSDPGDALKRVKEQLRAVPRKGIGYGLLRHLGDPSTRAELESLPGAPISFNYLGQIDTAVVGDSLFGAAHEHHGALRAPEGRRAHPIDVVAAIVGGRLRVTWIFSTRLHRRETVQRLADAYAGALRGLVAHCRDPRAGGYTPSDFPQMDLSAEELDALMRDLDDRVEEHE